MSDRHMSQQTIARSILSIRLAIDDLIMLNTQIGEDDARAIDDERFRLDCLSQTLRFTTLQAAE